MTKSQSEWQLDRQMLICLNSRILIINSDLVAAGGTVLHTQANREKLNMLFQAQPRNFRELPTIHLTKWPGRQREKRVMEQAQARRRNSNLEIQLRPRHGQRLGTFGEAALPPSVLRRMSRASQHRNAAKSRSEKHHLPASAEKQPSKPILLHLLPARWQST